MNKYLEKIAVYADVGKAMETLIRRSPKSGIYKGLGIGAGVGLGAGYAASQAKQPVYEKNRVVDRYLTKKEKAMTTGILGAEGAFLGGVVGALGRRAGVVKKILNTSSRHSVNFQNLVNKAKSKSFGSTSMYRTRTVSDILKDLEAPSGGFKTKAEATKHFRRAAMKAHPDRGGSNEAMSKINKAFDEFKAHPNGFEKLAGFKHVSKIVDIIKRNPGATIGGGLGVADGVASTTRQKNESSAKFHLRQMRNAALRGTGGMVVGEVLEKFVKGLR